MVILYGHKKWDDCGRCDMMWCILSYFAVEVVSIPYVDIDGVLFIFSSKGAVPKIALVK